LNYISSKSAGNPAQTELRRSKFPISCGLVFRGGSGWEKLTFYLALFLGATSGRPYATQGDKPKARTAYQDFLASWKDADADVPVLKAAQAE
jgi:hypothetical protein